MLVSEKFVPKNDKKGERNKKGLEEDFGLLKIRYKTISIYPSRVVTFSLYSRMKGIFGKMRAKLRYNLPQLVLGHFRELKYPFLDCLILQKIGYFTKLMKMIIHHYHHLHTRHKYLAYLEIILFPH